MTVTEPELLVGGSGDADAPPRRWPWVVAAVLAAVLLGLGWVDSRVRAGELDALAEQVSSAQAALDQGDARVAAMLAYGQPLLSRASLEPSLREDLEDLVRAAHEEAALLTAQARADLAAVRVMAWHDDVAVAVAAYDDYLEARAMTSTAAADELAVGFASHPEHQALLGAARGAMLAAAAGDREREAAFERALR